MERASTTFRTEGRRESLSNCASDCPFQDSPFDPRDYGHARIDPIHPGGSPSDPSLWFLSKVPFRTHVRTGSLARGDPSGHPRDVSTGMDMDATANVPSAPFPSSKRDAERRRGGSGTPGSVGVRSGRGKHASLALAWALGGVQAQVSDRRTWESFPVLLRSRAEAMAHVAGGSSRSAYTRAFIVRVKGATT